MSQQSASPASPEDRPSGDPWHAFGYIVSGVGVYGALGWLADRLLGTTFLVAVGILIGAGFGIYMTFARFNRVLPGNGTNSSTPTDTLDQE
jgi:F0F1-type ATP synthase assembly protein I